MTLSDAIIRGRVWFVKEFLRVIALSAVLALAGPPATAQVRSIDPNGAIDRDLASPPNANPQEPQAPPAPGYGDPVQSELPPSDTPAPTPVAADPGPGAATAGAPAPAGTYHRDDVFTAAERVFGKGAAGLGNLLERILKDQGDPSAYITGREASGAILVGLRYGSGTLSHKIEGDQPVYWTGPSVGFDAGGNASKVFVLVYNLYDSHDIFRRFPEGEGHLYLVGGFSATYLRRGNIVIIPVRLGVGVRAGVNVGYMKFSAKAKWVPF